jgi:hypothetical protein
MNRRFDGRGTTLGVRRAADEAAERAAAPRAGEPHAAPSPRLPQRAESVDTTRRARLDLLDVWILADSAFLLR